MITALKKAAGLRPNNLDKKLREALAEMKRLAQRYAAIKAELSRKVDTTYFESKAKSAAEEYARSQSPEDLERLILADFVLSSAQERIAGLRRAFAYGNAVEHSFWSECPNWKTALSTACQFFLEKAQAALADVTRAESERLGSSFDADEVEQSPVVRRAASTVKSWEYRLKAIQTDPPEACWTNHASVVLNGE